MNLPKTAAILIDERLAVSQYLIGFAEVKTHRAAVAPDPVDEEVPAGRETVARRLQSMPAEGLIGVARDGFVDMAAKQQADEKPAEILLVVTSRKVNANSSE